MSSDQNQRLCIFNIDVSDYRKLITMSDIEFKQRAKLYEQTKNSNDILYYYWSDLKHLDYMIAQISLWSDTDLRAAIILEYIRFHINRISKYHIERIYELDCHAIARIIQLTNPDTSHIPLSWSTTLSKIIKYIKKMESKALAEAKRNTTLARPITTPPTEPMEHKSDTIMKKLDDFTSLVKELTQHNQELIKINEMLKKDNAHLREQFTGSVRR